MGQERVFAGVREFMAKALDVPADSIRIQTAASSGREQVLDRRMMDFRSNNPLRISSAFFRTSSARTG